MQRDIKSKDVYGRTFQLDKTALAAMAARLEVRGKHPFFARVIDEYLARFDLGRLQGIIEIGTVFDGDYASMTFTTESPDHGKGQDETLINAVVAHPRVMRIMPRLLKESGLVLRDAMSYVVADIGAADFFKAALPSFRILLPRAGAMTEALANEYVSTLEAASDKGHFCGASNFYTYIAERPA